MSRVLSPGSLDPAVLRAIQAIASVAGVTVCTSTTRPNPPDAGMQIYETDTGKLLIYNGATSSWVAPVAVWA